MSYNFNFFQEYCSNHRPHQKEALLAAADVDKGQVLSPCGTGKTRIQISLHIQNMIEKSLSGETGSYLIASHRLALNRQLLNELVIIAQKCGLRFNILNISSDQQFGKKYGSKYFRTTDKHQASAFVKRSKRQGRHVIIIATYDSVDKLAGLDSLDLVTFDESHNTTALLYYNNIVSIKHIIRRQFYFTATRKVTKDRIGGMDDEEFYGPVIFDFSPRKALDTGEIVCPKLHPIKAAFDGLKTAQNNTKMIVKNTIEAFVEHKRLVKSHSNNPDILGAKLLITTNSVEEMLELYGELRSFCHETKTRAFAISCNDCMVDFIRVNKTDFLEDLNNLRDEEDAIIMHYDILTEGIDLPSITGVMPHRNLKEVKLMQLIGRCLRLHKTDRNGIYSGELKPGNALTDQGYDGYTKPYGWCIIPAHLQSVTDYEEMKVILQQVFSYYGTPMQEYSGKRYKKSPTVPQAIVEGEEEPQPEFELRHNTESLVTDNLILNEKQQAQLTERGTRKLLSKIYSKLHAVQSASI